MLTILRFWFRLAGRLAPGATARLAVKFFLSPVRYRVTAPGAESLLAAARCEDIALPDGRLRVYHWPGIRPGAPRVLVSHGWSDSVGNLAPLIRMLCEAGYAVTAPDWPAHGASAGRRTNIREWQTAIRRISAQYGPWHAVLGHSLGAFLAAGGTRTDLPQYGTAVDTERLVLIAAPDRSGDLLELFGDMLAIPAKVLARMPALLSEIIDAEFRDFSVARDVAEFDGRVLAVHDLDDRRVPVAAFERLRRAAPRQRYLATTGMGHRRLLEDPQVLLTIRRFLNEPGRLHAPQRAAGQTDAGKPPVGIRAGHA